MLLFSIKKICSILLLQITWYHIQKLMPTLGEVLVDGHILYVRIATFFGGPNHYFLEKFLCFLLMFEMFDEPYFCALECAHFVRTGFIFIPISTQNILKIIWHEPTFKGDTNNERRYIFWFLIFKNRLSFCIYCDINCWLDICWDLKRLFCFILNSHWLLVEHAEHGNPPHRLRLTGLVCFNKEGIEKHIF